MNRIRAIIALASVFASALVMMGVMLFIGFKGILPWPYAAGGMAIMLFFDLGAGLILVRRLLSQL